MSSKPNPICELPCLTSEWVAERVSFVTFYGCPCFALVRWVSVINRKTRAYILIVNPVLFMTCLHYCFKKNPIMLQTRASQYLFLVFWFIAIQKVTFLLWILFYFLVAYIIVLINSYMFLFACMLPENNKEAEKEN